MTDTRTILGAALAGIAALAAFRALAPREVRAANPARPAPPGCVRDGKARGSGRCDRCGRPVRGSLDKLSCDGSVVVYCGPKCAALWLDREKSQAPVEVPFWARKQSKCCTESVNEWNSSEWLGQRTQREIQQEFADAAASINWDPNSKGPASMKAIMRILGRRKREAYQACRAAMCGVAMIQPGSNVPDWAPAVVVRDTTNPNVWLVADDGAQLPEDLFQLRYAPRERLWKVQRRGRTVTTARTAEIAVERAQVAIGQAIGANVPPPVDAWPYDDWDPLAPREFDNDPPPYDDDIPF